MATINPHTTRATGTILTAAIYNADHQNHISNANALNAALVAAQGDIIVAEASIAQLLGFPRAQKLNADGTITFTPGTRFVIFDGIASGGAGGGTGINGLSNTAGAGGGGGTGSYGRTDIINVTAIPTATVTIGPGGTGDDFGDGNSGGHLVVVCGAVTYTWLGGTGGQASTLNGSVNQIILGGAPSGGINLLTTGGDIGGHGHSMGTETTAVSGEGGSTRFGTGGYPQWAITTAALHGNNGSGHGSGGSGGVGIGPTAIQTHGGAGTKGTVIAWEF